MKELEQALARSRAKLRNFRARIPYVSRGVAPVRLVLHLGEVEENQIGDGAKGLSLAEWKEAIVAFVAWLGPIPVCIDTTGEDATDLAIDLVRFANRLECPSHLLTTGPVSDAQAIAFVDRGLGAVTARVAGLDEKTQQAVLHCGLDACAGSLAAFVAARAQRTRKLVLQVNIPAHEENIDSLSSIAGWARQVGVDGVSLGLLLGSPVPTGLLEQLGEIPSVDVPSGLKRFLGGVTGGGFSARASLRSNGALHASLALPSLGNIREVPPADLWRSQGPAIQEALRHPRPYEEIELLTSTLRTQR